VKRLLIFLLVLAGSGGVHGHALASEGGGCCGSGDSRTNEASPTNDQDRTTETGKQGDFCSWEQEGELLELLRELNDSSLGKKERPGGKSEVRRKYRIARKLRQFDDCRAKDALERLIKENACEDLGEGEIFCVKWGASSSLQEIKSKKDLKKLTPNTPLEDQLKIIKKYGPHPHENEFASHAVMKFLIEQSAANPKVYVPLLVEYFPTCHEIMEVVHKYPQETNIGLKRCLFATEPTVVWAGINLARVLGKFEFLPTVYAVAFEKIGPLDYSQQADVEEIQTMGVGFFRMFEKDALQYYRGVLFGDFEKGKEYVVSGIRDLENPKLLSLLKEFSSYLQSRSDKPNGLLAERVQKKIAKMEEAQK
jgi:hypothetical protein